MGVVFDINSTSNLQPIDNSTPRFYLNIAAKDANVNIPSGNRYITILRKSEIIDLYGGINNIMNSIYRRCLYHLAGLVPIYIYNDYNNILADDNIDIIFLDMIGTSLGSGFISYLESIAQIAEVQDALLFADIDNVSFADLNSYNNFFHDNIALFYGYLFYSDYSITVGAEFITALQFLVQNNLLFCGVNYKTTARSMALSSNIKSRLNTNNVNYVNRNIIMHGVLLSGKHISAKLGHMYIKGRIRSILKQFIGRVHDEYLWQEVSEAIRKLFSAEISRYLCGPKRVVVICDATNNIISSNKLNVEIQYEGAYTEDIPFSRQIRITVEL